MSDHWDSETGCTHISALHEREGEGEGGGRERGREGGGGREGETREYRGG